MWQILPAFAAGAVGSGLLLGRRRLAAWRKAAEASFVRVVESSGTWALKRSLRGHAGALEVRIEESRERRGGLRVVVAVPGPPGFAGVKIRPESHRHGETREIEIGDEDLDRAFYIAGPKRLVFALLDAEAR